MLPTEPSYREAATLFSRVRICVRVSMDSPAARATRFTNAGDTILCVGVESSSAPEAALERSRRLEVYLADGSLREKVASRIAEAFKKAFVEGYFKVPSIA